MVAGRQPFRLQQIRADEQRVAGRERGADVDQERVGAGRIEVADVGTEKQRQRSAAGSGRPAPGPDLDEARFVRRLVHDNLDRPGRVHRPERSAGEIERRC